MQAKAEKTQLNNRFFVPGISISSSSSRSPQQLEKMKGMLNSDRIKYLFDDYKVKVLYQKGSIRVSNLHSNNVMRTCAVVNFSESIPSWLKDAHNKILKGGSIGDTIRACGLKLNKENLFIGNSAFPEVARERMEIKETSGAVHIYQLSVENPVSSEKVNYCTITEAHSPQYLSVEDLIYLSPSDTLKCVDSKAATKYYLNALCEIDDLFPKLGMSKL